MGRRTHGVRTALAVMDQPRSLVDMPFDRPVPDLSKLLAAWQEWERGEESPGKVLANMKTAGLGDVLSELVATGWVPSGTD